MLGGALFLLKYELARVLRYGWQQVLCQKQVTVIDFIGFEFQVDKYQTIVAQFQLFVCHHQQKTKHHSCGIWYVK